MKKEVTAVFKLTEKEIREALYDFYVRKLKSNNINSVFSAEEIKIESLYDILEVSLTITDERDLN